MNDKIKIRLLTQEDESLFPDALELLNRTQGRDLFASDYVQRKISSPEARVYGAILGTELVAVGVAELINSVEYYRNFDPGIVSELGNKTIGSFSTLCVREDLQGKGIGRMISEQRLAYLKAQNVPVIVGISWVSGKEHTSNRVFEKTGFRAVKLVENFFYQSSIERPFHCPGCGDPPCTCSAILYRLDL